MSGPVVIMAGGTGGHIFPGLAVAEVLRAQKQAVIWLGTRRGLEARLVPPRGIEIEWVTIEGLRGKGWRAWLVTPLRMLAAVYQVLRAFRRRRPGAVLGMGGFVSGPGGIAAWLARKPLIIHEQNAVAGTTNRALARFATRVFAAFPDAFPAAVHAQVIGNPVREAIAGLPEPRARFEDRPRDRIRLLVIGGSQGAKVLNEIVPAALAGLPEHARPLVRHQAGRTHDAAVAAYRHAGVEAEIEPFLEDMASAYSWADFVIARAGALTVAELAAVGIGAVLVPYPYAIDDHQTKNALRFCANGAGIVIPEVELTPERLRAEIERFTDEPRRRLDMAEAARSQFKPDAARHLADACVALARATA